MNKIDAIVVHCSATRAGQDIGKKEITQMHLKREDSARLGTTMW